MASVWTPKHKSKNLWRVRYREGGRETKAQYATGWVAKKEAEDVKQALERRFEVQALAGKPATAATSIPVLLEKWGRSRLARGHAKQPRVTSVRETVTRLAKNNGWKRLEDITAQSLDAWIQRECGITEGMLPAVEAEARMAARGVRDQLGKIRCVLRWAKANDLQPHESAIAVRLGRKRRRAKKPLLTVDQVTEILLRALAVGGFATATLIEHLALYACRPIDLCRARVKDWDAPTRTITYRSPKNGIDLSHLVHELHAVKLDRLVEGRSADQPLFLDPWEREWAITEKTGGADALTSWYRVNIGDKVVPDRHGIYHLKRFAMTRLLHAAGGDRELVITMSGHLDPQMVDTYNVQNAEGQAKLIEAVPLINQAAPAAPGPSMPVADMRPLSAPDGEQAPMATKPKRGFAALSPEKRREIAQRAYRKMLATGKAHRFTSAEARAASTIGGFMTMDHKRRRIAASRGGQTTMATHPERQFTSADGTAFTSETAQKAQAQRGIAKDIIVVAEGAIDVAAGE